MKRFLCDFILSIEKRKLRSKTLNKFFFCSRILFKRTDMNKWVIKLWIDLGKYGLVLHDKSFVIFFRNLCLHNFWLILSLKSWRIKQVSTRSLRGNTSCFLSWNWDHLNSLRKSFSKRIFKAIFKSNFTDIRKMQGLFIILKLIYSFKYILFMARKRFILLYKSCSLLINSRLTLNYSSLFCLWSAWWPCILFIDSLQKSSFIKIWKLGLIFLLLSSNILLYRASYLWLNKT